MKGNTRNRRNKTKKRRTIKYGGYAVPQNNVPANKNVENNAKIMSKIVKILPDGTKFTSRGSKITPKGSKITPKGTRFTPKGTKYIKK